MLAQLYIVLVFLAALDVVLIAPALRSAGTPQVIGRLISTLLVLLGLITAAIGRVAETLPLVMAGVLAIILGLLGYTITLPENGVLDRVRRAMAKRHAS